MSPRPLLALAALFLTAFQEPAMHRATGEFDVKINPVSADAPVGVMTLDKTFRGDLAANAAGRMLTWHGEDGIAAYTALERVTGTLHGRQGSFVLAHRGIMNARQKGDLSILIVEDSGQGALAGIAGRLDIEIKDGRHLYTLDYTLPPAR